MIAGKYRVGAVIAAGGIAAVCDSSQSCVTSGGAGHFGDPCTVGTDCFNGVCRAGV